MKTRPRPGAALAFVRTTAIVMMSGVALTATARLAASSNPPMDRGARPARPVAVTTVAHTDAEGASVVDLRPDHRGVAEIDASRLGRLAVGDAIDLSPRADRASERFTVSRIGQDGIGSTWWRLDSTEFEESQAVLVERRGFVSAWMQSPAFGNDFEWMFRSIGRGRMIPTPKAADLPGCGGSVTPPMGPEPPAELARMSGLGEEECSGCGALDADIAFFYTPLVLEQVETNLEATGGDPEDAPDVIAVRVAGETARATVAMENSALPYGTRLVHLSMVEFDEDGENFLGRFAGTDDGDMDEIHEIRDEVGADACSLVTLGDGGAGYCGVAYLGNGDSPGAAFSNLVWGCTGGLVFAHEFGHNLGCCHASGDGGGCDDATDCTLWEPVWAGCCMPDATGPDTPFPSFNHGWRFVVETEVPACVCTVMAYSKTNGASAQRIPYFSNPDIEFQGIATGSPEDDPDGRWADNAAVIRATMPGTARYRCESLAEAAESGRLVAAGLGDADFFGTSVATNGFLLAAGASGHNVAEEDAGSVMIFADPVEEPDDEPVGWSQIGKLTPSDLAEGDLFGHSVAMHEDLLVVGAPYTHRIVRDPDTDEIIEDIPLAGAASVWIGDGEGGFCRMQVLQPDDLAAYDFFGSSVAVAGDLVAVGAPRRETGSGTNTNEGAVWVYRRMGDLFELVTVIEGDDGSPWPQQGEDDPAGNGGRFGTSLAAAVQPSGYTVLLIGAPRELFGYGHVHPFGFVEVDGEWTTLPGGVMSGNWQNGLLGSSVAINGEDAIAGAPGANGDRGAAITYRVIGAELDEGDVLEYQNAEGDLAGQSVAINETFAVVGVPGRDRAIVIEGQTIVLEDIGAVAVFAREFDSIEWSLRTQEQPADLRPGDAFGSSAAVAGNRLFAGAPEADDAALLSGAVYAIDITVIVDCNENGLDDSLDILENPELDEDGDGIIDACEIGDCTADLNADGVVDGADLGLLFVHWGPCPNGEFGCPGDLDLDGEVDGVDLGLFCAAWDLKCPDDPAP